MTAPPTPRTFTAGEVETAAYMNSVSALLTFLLNPPRCRLYSNVAQSIPNSTWTALTFQNELFDTDTMHSTTTNPERITATTSGLYVVAGAVTFPNNGTGRRAAELWKNGSLAPWESYDTIGTPSSAFGTVAPLYAEVQLAAGDYIEYRVLQDSGAAMNTYVSATTTWVTCRWVAAS
jgi:hypothetical protein